VRKTGDNMISDWQNRSNRYRMEELQKLGYKFEVTSNGYMVWFNEEFLGGAGVKLPRESKTRRTSRMAIADLRDHLNSAIITAESHFAKQEKTE
jgi:hypothetical protein